MKIKINADKCQGHARCWSQAPHLIHLNEEGYLDPGEITVPDGEEKIAKRAVLSCPERALSLED